MKILYEDRDIIVVHKEAGIPVQSKRASEMDLVSEIRNHLQSPYLGVIHRLDQPVEGVMVFGKTKEAAASLSKQLNDHVFNKCYDALVFILKDDIPEEGTLRDHLITDRKTNMSRIATGEEKGAREAVLTYLLTDMTEADGRRSARARINLQTGRHHQIRLQMANAGMPVIGDRKYGAGSQEEGSILCLAASSLGFFHPADGRQLEYDIMPAFFKNAGCDEGTIGQSGRKKENSIE